jgi:hypothetical protein
MQVSDWVLATKDGYKQVALRLDRSGESKAKILKGVGALVKRLFLQISDRKLSE